MRPPPPAEGRPAARGGCWQADHGRAPPAAGGLRLPGPRAAHPLSPPVPHPRVQRCRQLCPLCQPCPGEVLWAPQMPTLVQSLGTHGVGPVAAQVLGSTQLQRHRQVLSTHNVTHRCTPERQGRGVPREGAATADQRLPRLGVAPRPGSPAPGGDSQPAQGPQLGHPPAPAPVGAGIRGPEGSSHSARRRSWGTASRRLVCPEGGRRHRPQVLKEMEHGSKVTGRRGAGQRPGKRGAGE